MDKTTIHFIGGGHLVVDAPLDNARLAFNSNSPVVGSEGWASFPTNIGGVYVRLDAVAYLSGSHQEPVLEQS